MLLPRYALIKKLKFSSPIQWFVPVGGGNMPFQKNEHKAQTPIKMHNITQKNTNIL